MKILVCGGRNYRNQKCVNKVLNQFTDLDMIIHGAATGADQCAQEYIDKYAKSCIAYKRYPAEWNLYGSSAGPIRNKFMLDDNPDLSLVIAFPGGKGTENMVKQATSRNICVMQIKE